MVAKIVRTAPSNEHPESHQKGPTFEPGPNKKILRRKQSPTCGRNVGNVLVALRPALLEHGEVNASTASFCEYE